MVGGVILPLERALLMFHVGGQFSALPLECVERIEPMAQLAHPPGTPSPVEGILNLGGRAVAVLRLDRLLQLPERLPGLYSMLILLKDVSDARVALLVDRSARFCPSRKARCFRSAGKPHSMPAPKLPCAWGASSFIFCHPGGSFSRRSANL